MRPERLIECSGMRTTDNRGWGYTKIRDALRGLKIEIGRTTVASILSEAGLEPAPERSRKRTWKQFIKNHWETLYACDFFSVETVGAFGPVRVMVFFVIELRSRQRGPSQGGADAPARPVRVISLTLTNSYSNFDDSERFS